MKIFINYRTKDEANIVYAIANSLMKEFGVENVFYDKQAIKPGSDFPVEIDKALENCRIFILVIGREWLSIMNRRQAFEEKDYVLNEIEHALDKGILILPVLVDDTPMPSEKDLPPKLSRLSLINAVNISSDPKRLPSDIKLLIAELNEIFSRPFIRHPRNWKGRKKNSGLKKAGWIIGSLISVIVIVVFAVNYFRNNKIVQKPTVQEKEQYDLSQSKTENNEPQNNQVADVNESDKIEQEPAVQEKEQNKLPQSKTEINNLKEDQVADTDGNIYSTVIIGEQKWMAENLKVTHYANGDPIPNITDLLQWVNSRTGAYCSYNNLTSNSEIYGHLYNAFAIMDERGLCPAAWHVPSKDEFKILLDYLGGGKIAGGMLKESGFGHWEIPNTGANNRTGFTALPGGNRTKKGFRNINWYNYLWSSSRSGSWWLHLTIGLNDTEAFISHMIEPWNGESVRCIKD